ncbi:MAG TPA: flagellar motor stator protein MotA [Bryobacteraceae bacterium]|jgi:chemotaxis protein MotA|nr:flagellar motor stator protein MotA [Bryobacteraceae bacterium]
MLALIGVLAVFAAVLGGYLLEHGNPWVLFQPAELLIVVGASAGTVLIAHRPRLIRHMIAGTCDAFLAPPLRRESLLSHLRMLYEVFCFVQRAGIAALENDVDSPHKSQIFSRYPQFLRDRETRDFICDSLRMMVIGATAPHELDQLMDLDIEVQRRGRHEPVLALHTVADSLPGLGIVAAVLGVVITMQAIGGSPESVGQKVAAALVGTFLGILLCYGVVGPVASRLESLGEEHAQALQVMRVAICSFVRGSSPILAVEYARRSVPVELRPSFLELETTVRKSAKIPAVSTPGEAAPPPEVPSHAQAVESAVSESA